MKKILHLDSQSAGFNQALNQLTRWESVADDALEKTVKDIIANVRANQDNALLEYTERFDNLSAERVAELEIGQAELKKAFDACDEKLKSALQVAAERIRVYHDKQRQGSWEFADEAGCTLGQKITPLDKVGLYVPGGKAAYPSSVLMNAIPAKVAGVPEIIMVVPAPSGVVNQAVLAAAHLAGVSRVFKIGGAQAVAALAYGTETIPRVDKIVGPGNKYVAMAKKCVFGHVGIDMVAGPSEVVVVGDGSTPADWVAMDLFAQAEHDESAQSILISPDADYLNAVGKAIAELLPTMPRQQIIEASLSSRGAFILVKDLVDACDVVNRIAPEHLELSVDKPHELLSKIRHAGAIFMGHYAAESLGDYCAGPNHVLPTSGTARFSSPLGVYDFQKRTSVIEASKEAATTLGEVAVAIAEAEGLVAHQRAAEVRINREKS